MTTKESTPRDGESVTESIESDDSERWQYVGKGSGRARDEMFGALLDDVESVAQVYPVRDDVVHIGIVTGSRQGEGPRVDAAVELSPDQAEALARDLFETAQAAREEGGE